VGGAGESLNLGHRTFINAALAALNGAPGTGVPVPPAKRVHGPLGAARRWPVNDGKNGPGASEPPAEQALSDPMFANLYLFRHVHSHRLLAGPLPCVSGTSYDGARYLLPLFALHEAPVDALRERLAGHDCFYPLAQHQVEALDAARFESTSARDDADYLYPAEHFRHYRGTALNKKRNLVTQLLRAHEVTVDAYAVACIDDALTVLSGWMSAKAKASGEADEAACTEALQLAPTLGLQGFVHRVDGIPAGFVLAQPLRPGVWVMRFAKGLDRFKGIYQHMFQHFCLTMPGVQWLNFEQDMGVANFRRSKLSYQPSALIPKYRVRLR
jgi:hypothetical protein